MANSSQIKTIEKKCLSYLFKDKRYIAQTIGKLSGEHFPNYAFIYNLLSSYYNKFRDVVTDQMVDIMFAKKNLSTDEITMYKSLIGELKITPINNDAEFCALMEELTEYKKRCQYLNMAEIIADTNTLECSSDDLKKMEQNVKNIFVKTTAEQSSVRKEGTITQSIDERLSRYKEVKNNPEAIKGIPTGFKHIDDKNGGFRNGELIYVIGRKGDGKSVLLLNLGHNAWIAGENVIIFSLEISKEDYERRFDARAAGVCSNGLKMGTLTDVEEELYFKYLENLKINKSIDGKKTGVMYIVDVPKGCTPAFIEAKLDTIEQTLGIKFGVIITDYSQIMQPNVPVGEKRHELGQIALDQKRIARERDCVVISAAQKTRAGAKEKNSDSSFVAESDQVTDHIDWGIDIMSTDDDFGLMQSFKTRDAEPFKFRFKKAYNKMLIQEIDDGLAAWDQIS